MGKRCGGIWYNYKRVPVYARRFDARRHGYIPLDTTDEQEAQRRKGRAHTRLEAYWKALLKGEEGDADGRFQDY
ncbi:MAG: hypothetical protein IIB62_02175 [Proteobacteria bacterium]|nr:hypothetical protein [Pseudomonadota bacterium]